MNPSVSLCHGSRIFFVKTHNLNLEVAFHFIIVALKLGSFFDSLSKLPPKDIDDLRTRASSYIQMEYMVDPWLPASTKIIDTLAERTRRRAGVRGQPESRSIRSSPSSTLVRPHCSRKRSKYYRYHRNYGHTTEGKPNIKRQDGEVDLGLSPSEVENKILTTRGWSDHQEENEHREGSELYGRTGCQDGTRRPSTIGPQGSKESSTPSLEGLLEAL
ncbi:hypothetical protein CR513_17515, partial [Mucuna pruriens]